MVPISRWLIVLCKKLFLDLKSKATISGPQKQYILDTFYMYYCTSFIYLSSREPSLTGSAYYWATPLGLQAVLLH